MDNNFFRRISDSLKEFSKKDAVICAGIAIVIIVLIVNAYLSNKDKDTALYKDTPASSAESKVTSTELEARLENILSKINGTGKVNVMITYTSSEAAASNSSDTVTLKPLGAVVIAEGAENLEVRIKIQQAVQTALGIEAHQVKIFRMSDN